MKLVAMIVFTASALTGCAAAVPEPPKVRISSAAELTPLFGKRLTFKTYHSVINEDNTITGEASGTQIGGTWKFVDGYFCREMTEGPEGVMKIPSDCQVLEVAGNTLFGTRDKGNGTDFYLEIQQ